MSFIAPRLNRIKPSPSSMAGQRARTLRAQGRDIVSMAIGEPDFDTPEHVIEAATRAMSTGKIKYTDVGGTPELRAAVREKFQRDNGLEFSLDEIVVGTGAKQIIFNALMSTVTRGDEVIVPVPYWVSYPDMVILAGGTPVLVRCEAGNRFKLKPEDLDRAITQRTKWVILNSPNNPSGSAYSGAEMAELTQVLARHPHVWVLSDDIYEKLLYDGREFATPVQMAPALKERCLTVNGVSKAYAMTGWRIGYGAGPANLVKVMVKLQSHSTSNPSWIGQAGAIAALTGDQRIVRERTALFQQRRDRVVDLLNAVPGMECHKPEGAFYLFPSCAGIIGATSPAGQVLRTDEDFILYLLESQGVVVIQGAAYGMSPYIRISYAAPMETLEEGCKRIRLACEALRFEHRAADFANSG